MVIAGESVKAHVGERSDERLQNLRPGAIVKAERDPVPLEQLEHLVTVPGRVPEFDDVSAAVGAGEQLDQVAQSGQIDGEIARQLIEHRAELGAEAPGAREQTAKGRAGG